MQLDAFPDPLPDALPGASPPREPHPTGGGYTLTGGMSTTSPGIPDKSAGARNRHAGGARYEDVTTRSQQRFRPQHPREPRRIDPVQVVRMSPHGSL